MAELQPGCRNLAQLWLAILDEIGAGQWQGSIGTAGYGEDKDEDLRSCYL